MQCPMVQAQIFSASQFYVHTFLHHFCSSYFTYFLSLYIFLGRRSHCQKNNPESNDILSKQNVKI